MNGKGSKPRNCFSKQFKLNYDEINWNSPVNNERTNQYRRNNGKRDQKTNPS